MSAFFAVDNGRIVNVSLIDTEAKWSKWNDKEVAFIKYAYGVQRKSLDFHFYVDGEEPTVEIVVCGQYLHNEVNRNTESFKNLLKQFPKWADVTPGLANYESWIY